MSFFQLLRREMHGSLPKLVFMSAFGGISNAAILATINSGTQAAGQHHASSLWTSTLFVIALILFIKTQYYIVITCAAEIETIIHKLRVRLMDGVRRSELLPIESIGRSRIVAAITSDTTVLKQASSILIFGVQGLIVIFFVAIYVAYLSFIAFALSVVLIGVAAMLFRTKSRQLEIGARQANEWENRLFDRLSDFLDGFKEVRLNRSRSDGLFNDACEVSRTTANIKIWTDAESLKTSATAQSLFYLLLGGVVFLAPTFSGSLGSGSITETTTALLFVVGACFGLVQSMPVLMAANAAADRINQLEADLRATAVSVELSGAEPTKRFEKIEMHDIVFRYVDKASDVVFQVGPVDFELHAGDLVFITGGNGSGKSTFMKLLAGLYPPESGEITLDGTRIDDNTREAYRVLMAAILTDYHLFKRLYGIPGPDPAELDRLLTQFRLHEKTHLTEGEFSTLDLSGGQRKRLALIVSLLEKRPILLLDEWTSNQDPDFRRKFYDDLLPAMKRTGTTVVVVTHDDRYLDELDLPARRFCMDEGRFVEQHSMQEED